MIKPYFLNITKIHLDGNYSPVHSINMDNVRRNIEQNKEYISQYVNLPLGDRLDYLLSMYVDEVQQTDDVSRYRKINFKEWVNDINNFISVQSDTKDRFQKLAGIIPEIKLQEPADLDSLFDKGVFDDIMDPINKGLHTNIRSEFKKHKNEVVNGVMEGIDEEELDEEDEDFDEDKDFLTSTLTIMIFGKLYMPAFYDSLVSSGFILKEDEGGEVEWEVPNDWMKEDGLLSSKMLTSYGIIWGYWFSDLDTDERESLGDVLDDEIQNRK